MAGCLGLDMTVSHVGGGDTVTVAGDGVGEISATFQGEQGVKAVNQSRHGFADDGFDAAVSPLDAGLNVSPGAVEFRDSIFEDDF